MGKKTIELREGVYDRLRSRKREDESFSDLVDRLLDESVPDRREGAGTLSDDEAHELEQSTEASRDATSAGLARRQSEVLSGPEDEAK